MVKRFLAIEHTISQTKSVTNTTVVVVLNLGFFVNVLELGNYTHNVESRIRNQEPAKKEPVYPQHCLEPVYPQHCSKPNTELTINLGLGSLSE